MRAIVYYSYSGNTREIVSRIKDKYDYDVLEIKPVIPYSDNYDEVVDRATTDTKNDYQPEIQKLDISKYDEIILCTPVWWYTVASPVNTFLHDYDLKDKVIIPVATNGGWLGHAIEDIEKKSGARIKNPVSLKFDGNELTEDDKFENWLKGLDD